MVGVVVKIKEIRDLSDNELHTRLNESYQEMFNLRFQLATRQLSNFQRLGEVRKTIAQIKTIMRERKLVARL